MLKRENRARVRYGTVGLIHRTPVVWVDIPTRGVPLHGRIDNETEASQATTPILVWQSSRNGRDYWLFDGQVYTTEIPLEPGDVRNLVVEMNLREQARLARAAAAAERETLSPRPDRPPIPPAVRSAVWRRDRGQCVNCGSREKLQFDHLIPVSMGGADTEGNLQLLCVRCNMAKGGNLV